MKKVLLLIMLFILTLILTSCSDVGDGMLFLEEDNDKIADETFNEIMSAVKSKDDAKIADMFSNAIKSNDDLSRSALRFVGFIQGDIISFSTASESGVGEDSRLEDGKRRKEIQSSFCVITTECTYYVAIKECIVDEFDDNNIGVLSLYIIESNNWTEEYVYRGGGKWIPGINIVETGETPASSAS